MTMLSKTLHAVLDSFQKQEGIWKSSVQLSYHDIYRALDAATVTFAEWDPERGLYFLDLAGVEQNLITIDVTMLEFEGPIGSDHYRLEWTQDKRLCGIEFQTHAPGPLPFLPEISDWLLPEPFDRSPPLTLEAWQQYLDHLRPISPIL